MKFALLMAAVAAVTIKDVNTSPDSGKDPTHGYSVIANAGHKKVTDANAQRVADQKAMLSGQAADDAWRAKFNPKA